jgi:hypothetical protein
MKIAKISTFTHDVTILVPQDDGYREENVKVTFNYIGVEASRAFDLSNAADTTSYLKAIIGRLDDLTDDAGAPVAYTEQLRDQLLDMQYFRQGILSHYLDAVRKVKAGN